MTISRPAREMAAPALVLLAIFGLRLRHLDQPILENYVGRQVPTAMVARNLDRGSGFLYPQLDTGPFPNLFLVEPPVYAGLVVFWKRLTGLPMEPAGRMVSAIGTALGAWGLFGLVRRRERFPVALSAMIAFGCFPISIRYGRAFQPDALALGCLIAGLFAWDEAETRSRSAASLRSLAPLGNTPDAPRPPVSEHGQRPREQRPSKTTRSVEVGIPKWGEGTSGASVWRVAGWSLLAIGLAMKIIFAAIFLPLMLMMIRPVRLRKIGLILASMLPALLWYGWAAWLLRRNSGSRASLDNAAIWANALVPSALWNRGYFENSARFLLYRCFSPVGIAVAAIGFLGPNGRDRLWSAWAIASAGFLLLFAGKAHHEYYWLTLAPVVAIGFARGSAWLLDRTGISPTVRWAAVAVAGGSMIVQVGPTWRTPPEWSGLPIGWTQAWIIGSQPGLIVAPEALIYEADRRGCRLEFEPSAVRRAAGEWGGSVASGSAIDLVEFYRSRGARTFADVLPVGEADPLRRALHAEIRRRYAILSEARGLLIADLTEPGGPENAPER